MGCGSGKRAAGARRGWRATREESAKAPRGGEGAERTGGRQSRPDRGDDGQFGHTLLYGPAARRRRDRRDVPANQEKPASGQTQARRAVRAAGNTTHVSVRTNRAARLSGTAGKSDHPCEAHPHSRPRHEIRARRSAQRRDSDKDPPTTAPPVFDHKKNSYSCLIMQTSMNFSSLQICARGGAPGSWGQKSKGLTHSRVVNVKPVLPPGTQTYGLCSWVRLRIRIAFMVTDEASAAHQGGSLAM